MSTRPLHILGIAGSLRRASFNRGLIRAATQVAPPGISVTAFELHELPMYDGDLEAEGDPTPVSALKRAIGEADALLLATPEYNHCVPGVLKNAIDWASRPPRAAVLTGKPVAVMGASPGRGGTARAQAQLRDGLTFTGSLVLPLPELLVPLAGAKFDERGDLVDEGTRVEIRDLLVALAAWTRRLDQGERLAS
jgi:chromate reductase